MDRVGTVRTAYTVRNADGKISTYMSDVAGPNYQGDGRVFRHI